MQVTFYGLSKCVCLFGSAIKRLRVGERGSGSEEVLEMAGEGESRDCPLHVALWESLGSCPLGRRQREVPA